MWLFPHYGKEPSEAALPYQMRATEDNNAPKEVTLTSFFQVVNYRLENYAAEDVDAKAEADIINYK